MPAHSTAPSGLDADTVRFKKRRSRGRRVLRITLFTVGGLFALFIALAILGAIIGPPPGQTASMNSPAPSTTTPAAAAPAPPAPVTPPAEVIRAGAGIVVVDGDTFRIGPRTIEVLGIDSCEPGTDAGPDATGAANALLLGGPVTLTQELGVTTDSAGGELRYVGLGDGRDFGTTMTTAPHTAVLVGPNEANPSYLTALRGADSDGRVCDKPDPPRAAPVVVPDRNDDRVRDRPSVPAPAPRTRTATRAPAPAPQRDTSSSGSTSSGGGGGAGVCVKKDKNGRYRDSKGRFCSPG